MKAWRALPTRLPITIPFFNDTNLINTKIDIYRSITREEIKEVAAKYLKPAQRVELEYLPE